MTAGRPAQGRGLPTPPPLIGGELEMLYRGRRGRSGGGLQWTVATRQKESFSKDGLQLVYLFVYLVHITNRSEKPTDR